MNKPAEGPNCKRLKIKEVDTRSINRARNYNSPYCRNVCVQRIIPVFIVDDFVHRDERPPKRIKVESWSLGQPSIY